MAGALVRANDLAIGFGETPIPSHCALAESRHPAILAKKGMP